MVAQYELPAEDFFFQQVGKPSNIRPLHRFTLLQIEAHPSGRAVCIVGWFFGQASPHGVELEIELDPPRLLKPTLMSYLPPILHQGY